MTEIRKWGTCQQDGVENSQGLAARPRIFTFLPITIMLIVHKRRLHYNGMPARLITQITVSHIMMVNSLCLLL